MISWPDFDN